MPDDQNPPAPPPAATPPPAPTPPPPAPPPPAFSWPEGWREAYAKTKGDDKLLPRLQRYQSPDAVIDSMIGLQEKMSRGEIKPTTPYPATGTPEQQLEWRRSQGIPDEPTGYKVELGDGRVLGEDDKPLLESFLKDAHGANLQPKDVNAVLRWYTKFTEQVQKEQSDNDLKARSQVEETLRSEYGANYHRNRTLIENLLDTGPVGTKDLLFGARAADGSALMNNVGVLKFLVDKALEINPQATVVGADGGALQQGAADSEIAQIKGMMGNPNSDYWKGPRADQLQARYRQLVEWRSKQK